MATQKDYISTGSSVFHVDDDSGRYVAHAPTATDAAHIAEVLNADAERRRKVETLRNALTRAHVEAGMPMSEATVNACAVDEAQDDTTTADDDADWSGLDPDGHRVRAGELLDDARAFFLRSIAPGQSEETRADARTRCRLLTGLAYGHAVLARSDR